MLTTMSASTCIAIVVGYSTIIYMLVLVVAALYLQQRLYSSIVSVIYRALGTFWLPHLCIELQHWNNVKTL